MGVKFSVVIPTHNRLELLRDAVGSVLRHKDIDLEVIVFDNGSEDPIGDFVAGLDDPRVSYSRSDEFLPVTDSWNTAIDLAEGEYVILIGDDDGLGPSYFERAEKIIDVFDAPDMIYSAFFQFFHPGVLPAELGGFVNITKNASFFLERDGPFLLNEKERAHAVHGSLEMKRNFVYNMQAMLFSKPFLDRLRYEGKVFHSPFPDYYLANVALAMGERIVADPKPLAIAGVSKASFGFTLFNNDEQRGAELLKTRLSTDPMYEACAPHIVPGPAYITNFIFTMAHVRHVLGAKAPIEVNFGRYRRLQTLTFVINQKSRFQWWRSKGGADLWARLRFRERVWATLVNTADKIDLKARSATVRRWLDDVLPYDPPLTGVRYSTNEFANLPEFLDALEIAAAAETAPPAAILSDGQPTPALRERDDLCVRDLPFALANVYAPSPTRLEGDRLFVLPRAEPWVYGASIKVADFIEPGANWVIVSVEATDQPFGVGVLDKKGGQFLSRAGVATARGPMEIWLPVDSADDPGELAILNWDRPRTSPLIVRSVKIVQAAGPVDEVVPKPNEAAGSFWRELAFA